ncbi:Dynein regulatory complex subunit 4 [Clonorchis sinensis]|uniref:Dynein regulatory complex subunit 4 n=2 Tax=Clonorchis sinensis TaxID=79923 RepID=A0A8T1MLR9_CLOSI|nr:Dynein regulatory complex subunit 4 [Clonorchis sinensis]
MPPKKAVAKKKKRTSKNTTVIHGVSTADMTKEEIEAFVILLREEVDRERQERNLATLEKEKIINFWELTKKQLEDSRAVLAKKEREIEDADERHQLEMKIYRQKLKHLMFEQSARESEAKKEAIQGLSNEKNEARSEIRAIRNENYTLKAKLRQQQVQSEEAVKMLKRQHELDLAHIRQDFSRQIEEIEARAAKQMNMLREQIDTQRRVEVHMTEEHKNKHIQTLEANHERAFANMKAYYNDITLGNISVIKTLRENIDELRSQLGRAQNLLESSQTELEQKTQTLCKLDKENAHLRHVAKLFESEKIAHMLTKQNAKKTVLAMQKTEMNLDIMTERFDALDKMRKGLASQFEKLLMDVQQRTGLRALLVERKLKHLTEALEAREAQITQLVIALNSDPSAVEHARQHLEELLRKKNNAIEELQYEVMRMGKAYNELWATCQRKLVDEMNSPVNLGIMPVKVNVNLTSPFNPSTAIGQQVADNTNSEESSQKLLGEPKATIVPMGQGPTGLASVAPF